MKRTKKLFFILLAIMLFALTAVACSVSAGAVNVGDIIEFGTYPQTQVSTGRELRYAASQATWKSYRYYSGTGEPDGNMTQGTWMQFADFYFRGDKIRAVKFTEFRPKYTYQTCGETNSITYDNGFIYTDNIYAFRYEPLQWRVLDPNKRILLCESLIDAQPYQSVISGTTYAYQGDSRVYANNYATSTIRDWLNYDFYHTAFTDTQKNRIQTVTYSNNSPYSGTQFSNVAFHAPATTDKIYLPSYTTMKSTYAGFASSANTYDSARKATGTDYAKCQGLQYTSSDFSNWWLRSPGAYCFTACEVNSSGSIEGYNHNVSETALGVRPSIVLDNLTPDNTESDALFSNVISYNVTAISTLGGYVSGAGSYTKNATATLTAIPNNDQFLYGWYINDKRVSRDESYSFTVTQDVKLKAEFYSRDFKPIINANAETGGSVSGGGRYTVFTDCTLTATPDFGYQFIGWYNGGTKVSNDAVYTFNVTDNITLTAKFQKDNTRYPVVANASEGGTASGGGSYLKGTTVTLTATPDELYIFVGWYNGETFVTEKTSYSFTVTDAVTLQARFAKKQCSVRIDYTGLHQINKRWITPERPNSIYDAGEQVTVYCELHDDDVPYYDFIGWYVDDEKISDELKYTFTVYESIKLTAKFQRNGVPIPVCPWCGEMHEGFFESIIGWFHSIFAKLFGVKYTGLEW